MHCSVFKAFRGLLLTLMWLVPSFLLAGDPHTQKVEFASVLNRIAAMAQRHPDRFPASIPALALQARDTINNLSDPQTIALGKALDAAPAQWTKLPETTEALLTAQAAPLAAVAPASAPSDALIALMVCKAAEQAAQIFFDFTPGDEVVVVLGEGGTVGPNPFRVAATVLLSIAQVATLVTEEIYMVFQENQGNAHDALLQNTSLNMTTYYQQTMAQLAADFASLQGQLTSHDLAIKAQLARIEAKLALMDCKLDKVINLLLTPPGRRDGFPLKTAAH